MRKKILLLNTTFKFEGPNDVLYQLATNVDASRFEIVCACMHEGGPMEKTYRDAGYETYNFRMERFTDVGAVFRVRDFIRSENIDLVTAQLLRAEVFGGCGAWLSGVPLVFVVQNIDSYRSNPLFIPKYYLSKLSMRWPVKVVAASEYVRDFVIKHQGVSPDHVITIHDAIAPAQFSSLARERDGVREEFNLRQNEIVIGTVARYDAQKGLLYLLDAFQRLASKYKEVRLVLVGDGPQRNEIEEKVMEGGIANKVILTGFRRDYDRIIQGFDIFVLPSIWEGFPLALLASMASAKPVVSTKVSGIPEAVKDGVNGFLVRPADSEALAERIERLICDEELRRRFGAKGSERVEKEFSSGIMAKKYESIWEECLGLGSSRETLCCHR